jgi:hypothetical protein
MAVANMGQVAGSGTVDVEILVGVPEINTDSIPALSERS